MIDYVIYPITVQRRRNWNCYFAENGKGDCVMARNDCVINCLTLMGVIKENDAIEKYYASEIAKMCNENVIRGGLSTPTILYYFAQSGSGSCSDYGYSTRKLSCYNKATHRAFCKILQVETCMLGLFIRNSNSPCRDGSNGHAVIICNDEESGEIRIFDAQCEKQINISTFDKFLHYCLQGYYCDVLLVYRYDTSAVSDVYNVLYNEKEYLTKLECEVLIDKMASRGIKRKRCEASLDVDMNIDYLKYLKTVHNYN